MKQKTKDILDDLVTLVLMLALTCGIIFLFSGCGPYAPEQSEQEIRNSRIQNRIDRIECAWNKKLNLCFCIYESQTTSIFSIAIDTLGSSCGRQL
jgi:hypothetical protein